jgi:hypothetical protein
MANYTLYVLPYNVLVPAGAILEIRDSETDEWAELLEDSWAQEKNNITQARDTRDAIRGGTFVFPCYE